MKKRDLNLDLARALAIFLVIVNHATEILYSFNVKDWMFKYGINTWAQISSFSRIFMLVMFTLGRIGVPLFLFITGSLIISKSIDNDEDVLHFYKKNLVPLLIVNLIWIGIYNIVFLLTNNIQNINLDFIFREMFFFKNVPVANMWYFPMIIGIYLVLPFISKIFRTFSKKSVNIILTVIFTYTFIIPMLNLLFGIFHINYYLDPVITLSFFGGGYGLYVILGYLAYVNNRDKIKDSILYIVGLLSFVITVLFQFLSYYKGGEYNVWYNFPFLLICSLCLFNIILKIDTSKLSDKFNNFMTYTSRISLGLFFVHIIVLYLLAPIVMSFSIIMPLKVIVLLFMTTLISYTLVYLLSKIKFISKYVFLIK